MPSEGLKPFNSNPFLRITDFKVPPGGIVLSLGEFDNTPDMAYLYDRDGVFKSSRASIPKDDPNGDNQHTAVAKVRGNVYSVSGGPSDYHVYKNGVGFIGGGAEASGAADLTSHGTTLWVNFGVVLASYDATTGSQLSGRGNTWAMSRHDTNGTHHAYLYFRGNTTAPDFRFQLVLAASDFTGENVLIERTIDQEWMDDIAINSDRVAATLVDYTAGTIAINIYDLTGALKDTLAATGRPEMLLMDEERLYCSDWSTGIVTKWDITAEVVNEIPTGEKIYTPAGSFSTPSPYVFFGNLAT